MAQEFRKVSQECALRSSLLIRALILISAIACFPVSAEAKRTFIYESTADSQLFPNVVAVLADAKLANGKKISSITTGFVLGSDRNIITGNALLSDLGKFKRDTLRIRILWSEFEWEAR